MDFAGLVPVPSPDPMTDSADLPPSLRGSLARLAGVRIRRMFGADAFFVGPVLFAFLAPEGLVLRLPRALRAEALRTNQARTFLGPLPEGLSGWAVVSYDAEVDALIAAAHQQAQALSRSVARRKRRTGRTRRTGKSQA